MNRSSSFEEDFQSCYIIDLADYRARKSRKRGRRARAGRTPPSRSPRIVGLMKKALAWQELLDSGEAPSRAELARREGITRARVTQIMKLLALAPEIHEAIQALPAGTPEGLVTERKLRPLVGMTSMDQPGAFRALVRGRLPSTKVVV